MLIYKFAPKDVCAPAASQHVKTTHIVFRENLAFGITETSGKVFLQNKVKDGACSTIFTCNIGSVNLNYCSGVSNVTDTQHLEESNINKKCN